ncbi:hypothetical protein BH11ACT4_BH11ACT4_09470 [soil metagenome]
MSDDNILAELEAKASEAEAAATKYRAAIALLRGETVRSGKPGRVTGVHEFKLRASTSGKKVGPTSTMSMIRTVLGRSTAPLGIAELTEKMLTGGWDTQSENPSNTVRTAVMRLVDDKGEVVKHVDGTYSLAPLGRARQDFGIGYEDDDDTAGD